jgi:Flp pilus assembly protein TadD
MTNNKLRFARHLSLVQIGADLPFRLIGLGLLWFYLTLLPESSLIPIPDVIYEHRVYLPFVGLILAASALLNAAFAALSNLRNLRYLSYLIIAWLLLLSAATARRAAVWGNEVRLWADVYAKAPAKPRAVKNYGVVLAASGKYDDGIKLLEKAVVLDPDNADYWSNLGTANLRAGRFDSAKDKFLTAYELLAAETGLPPYAVLSNLSNLSSLSNLSEKTLRQAAQYLNDYGVCLVQLNRGDEALAAFQKSLLIDPDLYAARLGLGAAYNLLGNIPAATDVFESLVEEFPDQPDAYNNLAVMYKKAGRLEDHDRILKAAAALKKLK